MRFSLSLSFDTCFLERFSVLLQLSKSFSLLSGKEYTLIFQTTCFVSADIPDVVLFLLTAALCDVLQHIVKFLGTGIKVLINFSTIWDSNEGMERLTTQDQCTNSVLVPASLCQTSYPLRTYSNINICTNPP